MFASFLVDVSRRVGASRASINIRSSFIVELHLGRFICVIYTAYLPWYSFLAAFSSMPPLDSGGLMIERSKLVKQNVGGRLSVCKHWMQGENLAKPCDAPFISLIQPPTVDIDRCSRCVSNQSGILFCWSLIRFSGQTFQTGQQHPPARPNTTSRAVHPICLHWSQRQARCWSFFSDLFTTCKYNAMHAIFRVLLSVLSCNSYRPNSSRLGNKTNNKRIRLIIGTETRDQII